MRKGILIVTLILGCVLLSGCTIGNSKTEVLSCNKNSYTSDLSFNEQHDLSFKGKKISEYKLILKLDLSAIASDKDLFDETVDKLREEYSKAIEKGVKTDVYPEGNYVIAMFTMNPELFDGILDYNNYDLRKIFEAKISLDDLKPEMEKQGYACEVSESK